MTAVAQKGTFRISGEIGKLNAPATAYLDYYSAGEKRLDSMKIRDGKFEFTGTFEGIHGAYLMLDHRGKGDPHDVLHVLLQAEPVRLVSKDSIMNAHSEGSQFYASWERLNKQLAQVNAGIRREERALKTSSSNSDNMEKYEALRKKRDKQQKMVYLAFVKDNPANRISLYALDASVNKSKDPEKYTELFATLSDEVRNSEAGKAITKVMHAIKSRGLNKVAPDFTLNDADGKSISLSKFRGQYVLVDFWASWCVPCRNENPHIVQAYEKYKNKNFTVLGISVDKTTMREAWLQAVKKDKLTWTQVSDADNEVGKLYGIQSIPQNILVNPKGIIVATNLRGEALSQKLAEILK
ncbi:peroxiredoxin [Sphingobacterium sp. JUb20]|nr:peroxiredoxin [Sphingobacterium sp. JUb20]